MYCAGAAFGLAWALMADVIQLKDQAAITGTILAEKPDQLVVDVGYTVLIVPRERVETITRTGAGNAPSEPGRESAAGPKTAGTGGSAPDAGNATVAPAPGLSGAAGRGGLFAASSGAGQDRSVRELVKELGEAVVQVRAPSGLGSGFFINDEGYLITNFHVIEGETQISVEVYHQRNGELERKTYKQVKIVAMNKFQDLALLKIEDAGAPRFVSVVLGSTRTVAVGERVFAIGSPHGLERTVTEGILSTKTRQLQGELLLQTSAQINPGNSGGPLFNLRGEVIGVTNMKINFGEGLGFAIPVERVRHFLENRDAFAYDNDNPSNAYRYLEPPRRLQKAIGQPAL
ncbi:MAG: putative serine protease HhoA precursor [Verrucomicrobia bacterium ADurb.Bin006]|jgi:serine protease Do|nr:MAG: putative serine protease HhoA precursor [Verrucomicrobia bacterium ADurb.Bin006]